jgi:hypothetical protein
METFEDQAHRGPLFPVFIFCREDGDQGEETTICVLQAGTGRQRH